MVDITEATMRGGITDCLKATLHQDNLPTYLGIGGGLIAGNAVGKKLQSFYDNSVDVADVPNRWVQLVARTSGRLLTSGAVCALAGSAEGEMKEGLQMAAVGSIGFVMVDLVRELTKPAAGEEPSWVVDYLTLQGRPTARRAVPRSRPINRAPRSTVLEGRPVTQTSRPVALEGRPAMESAALTAQPLMRTASLRV